MGWVKRIKIIAGGIHSEQASAAKPVSTMVVTRSSRRCSKVCRVFLPDQNGNIVMHLVKSDGQRIKKTPRYFCCLVYVIEDEQALLLFI